MFIRFDMIHERDRRTDGQTHRHRMTAWAALMHSIARQKVCARRFVLKLYRHEALRGLFATAELLVLYVLFVLLLSQSER